jgi:5'-nucleotidase
MPTHLRVLNTFQEWGIHVDEAFFMGGVAKTGILQAFKPHIFFDDQETHCRPAAPYVPTARVPAEFKAQSLDVTPLTGPDMAIKSTTESPEVTESAAQRLVECNSVNDASGSTDRGESFSAHTEISEGL